MIMTHKEALRVAREAVRERMASMSQLLSLEDLYDEQDEIQLRAYIEARGMVLMPSELTDAQKDAASAVGPDTPYGVFGWDNAEEIYAAMLAAAPDPFKE